MIVTKGAVDVTTYVMMVDSAAGTPETALTITNIDLQYTRNQASPATKVDATALAATNSAHADNKAIEIDSTSSPGLYRVDWPDAAFATGADKVILVVTCSGCAPAVIHVDLVNYNTQDGVRMGLTALPNAAADAAGGLPISDAGGLDLDAQLVTKINDILTDTGTTLQGELDGIQADTEDIQTRLPVALVNGRMDSTVDGTGMEAAALTAIVNAVWDETLAGHAAAGSTGEALSDAGSAGDPWSTALPGAYGAGTAGKIVGDMSVNVSDILTDTAVIGAAGAGLTALATQASVDTIDANVDAILADTGTDGVVVAAASKTGYALTSAYDFAKGTTAMTEAYAANGAAPTPVQAIMAVHQMLMQFAISSTTYTVKKLDNSTTAFVVTLDDATTPTSAVRT